MNQVKEKAFQKRNTSEEDFSRMCITISLSSLSISVLMRSLMGPTKLMLLFQMMDPVFMSPLGYLKVPVKLTSHGFHLMTNFVI